MLQSAAGGGHANNLAAVDKAAEDSGGNGSVASFTFSKVCPAGHSWDLLRAPLGVLASLLPERGLFPVYSISMYVYTASR